MNDQNPVKESPEEGSSDVGKSSRKIASVRSEVSVGVQI